METGLDLFELLSRRLENDEGSSLVPLAKLAEMSRRWKSRLFAQGVSRRMLSAFFECGCVGLLEEAHRRRLITRDVFCENLLGVAQRGSTTTMRWMLEHAPDQRCRVKSGESVFDILRRVPPGRRKALLRLWNFTPRTVKTRSVVTVLEEGLRATWSPGRGDRRQLVGHPEEENFEIATVIAEASGLKLTDAIDRDSPPEFCGGRYQNRLRCLIFWGKEFLRWAVGYFGVAHLSDLTTDPADALGFAMFWAAEVVNSFDKNPHFPDFVTESQYPYLSEIRKALGAANEKATPEDMAKVGEYYEQEQRAMLPLWFIDTFYLDMSPRDLQRVLDSIYSRYPRFKSYLSRFTPDVKL